LANWYSAALEAQEASGLSVAAFAERMGVSVPTLYMWRRRLGTARSVAESSSKFVEVTVTRPSSPAPSSGAMVVRLCAGRSVEVPRGFDDDELRRLIAVVESC
jgi:transposase-like protein